MHARTTHSREVTLTPAANDLIADYYTELRAGGGDRALPITVRTLETIIRLATAHAKVRACVCGCVCGCVYVL